MYTEAQIVTTTTSDLLELYNNLAKQIGREQVKRFADRKTAIRRTMIMLEAARAKTAYIPGHCPACYDHENQGKANEHRHRCSICKTEYWDNGRVYCIDEFEAHSRRVAETWKKPEVAEARRKRHGVIVDSVEYRSVAEAFRDLKLPMEKHIKFRMKLKAQAGKKIEEFGHIWEAFEI